MLVGEVFARMGLDSRQYEKGLGKLEGMTQKKAVTLGSIFKGAFSFALGMGLMSGFRSLGGAITDFVNTAARTEVLNVAMLSVARSSGYMTSAVEDSKRAIMDLGIAEQEATQILTRFMQAQLDTADAAKIARTAQDAAVIAGTNSSEAALTMTEAIAKLRPELLANYGMTRNLNDIYADYAKTAGKTATKLTETEKKQAMLNYILAEGDKIAGTYEASMGAVGKQIGSLPRYWDTLKNAIAKPLALPAISVIVDGITAGLKSAISWAEANKATLQSWGQTAANVAGFIVRGFQLVTRTFAENWGMIRFAATALLTYAVASRTAAGATALFQAISLALNGQLAAKIPLLSFVSTAMGIYKVQMALASAQGIVLTGVLAKVRVALYSVWTALGPIGWAILALSGLVAGGMALWNKYTQSLQRTASTGMGDFRKAEEGLAASAGDSSKALDDQTKALNKAGKAAQKNLQPFDEINQLQKESAAGGAGLPDMPTLGDLGGFGGGIPGLGDMLADMEAAKPTLKGFWKWIKREAGKIWDKVKKKWGNFKKWVLSWAGPFWDTVKEKWGDFKDWAGNLWDTVKTKWNNFKDWAQGKWSAFWDPIKQRWNNFKTWAGNLWDNIKTKWNNFKDWVQEKWSAFWDPIKQKWDNFKTWTGNLWDTVKIKWDNFKTNIQQKWNAFWDPIKTRWDSFKSWAGELLAPVKQKWDSFVTWARGIWDGLLKKWNEIKSWPLWKWIGDKATWLKNVFNFKWSLPKIKLPHFSVSWNTSGLLASVGTFLGMPGIPRLSVTWLAKGGLITAPMLAGLGEVGREAVIPLDTNTGWADIMAGRLVSALQRTQGAGAGVGGDVYVYIGNEQVDAYIYRSQDRRNIRSNGR